MLSVGPRMCISTIPSILNPLGIVMAKMLPRLTLRSLWPNVRHVVHSELRNPLSSLARDRGQSTMNEHIIKLDKDQLKATIEALEFAIAKMHGNSKVQPTTYTNCNLVA